MVDTYEIGTPVSGWNCTYLFSVYIEFTIVPWSDTFVDYCDSWFTADFGLWYRISGRIIYCTYDFLFYRMILPWTLILRIVFFLISYPGLDFFVIDIRPFTAFGIRFFTISFLELCCNLIKVSWMHVWLVILRWDHMFCDWMLWDVFLTSNVTRILFTSLFFCFY